MSITTTTIAIGKWENRENLDYKPCNNTLEDGNIYGAYGKKIPYDSGIRRPYKIDQTDGVAYIMYDDDSNGDVPIYKIVEG